MKLMKRKVWEVVERNVTWLMRKIQHQEKKRSSNLMTFISRHYMMLLILRCLSKSRILSSHMRSGRHWRDHMRAHQRSRKHNCIFSRTSWQDSTCKKEKAFWRCSIVSMSTSISLRTWGKWAMRTSTTGSSDAPTKVWHIDNNHCERQLQRNHLYPSTRWCDDTIHIYTVWKGMMKKKKSGTFKATKSLSKSKGWFKWW